MKSNTDTAAARASAGDHAHQSSTERVSASRRGNIVKPDLSAYAPESRTTAGVVDSRMQPVSYAPASLRDPSTYAPASGTATGAVDSKMQLDSLSLLPTSEVGEEPLSGVAGASAPPPGSAVVEQPAPTQQEGIDGQGNKGTLYMPGPENPPMTQKLSDPRGCLMRFFLPTCSVFGWQGCDHPIDLAAAAFFCCCFTFCCWKQPPRQKKFKKLGLERKVCCCECHPRDQCCRFWCPCHAILAWQGWDNALDNVLLLLIPVLQTAVCVFVLFASADRVNKIGKIAGHRDAGYVCLQVVFTALFYKPDLLLGFYAWLGWVPKHSSQKQWGLADAAARSTSGGEKKVGGDDKGSEDGGAGVSSPLVGGKKPAVGQPVAVDNYGSVGKAETKAGGGESDPEARDTE